MRLRLSSSFSSLPAETTGTFARTVPTRDASGSSAQSQKSRRKFMQIFQRNLSGYLFLLPALLVFFFFVWYPIVLGFIMSFQSVDLLSPATWVGWTNYKHIFADPLFGVAWRNTLAFTLYALLFGYLIPLILALFINEMRHARGFFRLAFYLPVMLPQIVTVFLWRWIYSPDSGLLNALLSLFHLPQGTWLESTGTALPALVVIATWSAAGGTMLIYLAALQGVPASLYEAAEIDGANLWGRLWHITFPNLRPILLLMLILQIVGTMQVFLEPFTLTDGGPRNATMTVLLLIYKYAFSYGDFGGASAMGVILFLVLAVFASIYMRLTSSSMQGD